MFLTGGPVSDREEAETQTNDNPRVNNNISADRVGAVVVGVVGNVKHKTQRHGARSENNDRSA